MKILEKLKIHFRGILLFLLFVSSNCQVSQNSGSNLNESIWTDKVKFAWQALPKSKTMCNEFDYFPYGGIRNFYCHLKDISNFTEVEKFFSQPVFLKGPHKDGFLILDDKYNFGYYNPEFPKFLRETMVPAYKDKAFRVLTQPIYDNYIQTIARIHYATYQKLHSNNHYLTQERVRYKNLINKRTLDPYYYEKYFGFLEEGFTDSANPNTSSKFTGFPEDSKFDGNVVKTAVSFWIRRSIDETDKEFFNGLRLLLMTYDADFIKSR